MKLSLIYSILLPVFALTSAGEVIAATTEVSPTLPEANEIVDRLVLGNTGSEKEHLFVAQKMERIVGGLDQSAVKLLPSETVSWQSAPMTFTMKVDPERQNYITLKLWGSDKGEECGRLFLFVNGLQVGYQHESDYGTLNQTDEDAEAPGRFVYQTEPLPPKLTLGQTSLKMTILAFGPKWNYGDTFAKFQKPFTKETRGIYSIYTHTSGYFAPPSDEVQGSPVIAPVRPASSGESVIEESRKIVIEKLNQALTRKIELTSVPNSGAYEQPLLFLAGAYTIAWTPAYKSPKTLDQIVQLGDCEMADFLADPHFASRNWVGAGPLGEAILETWPDISKRLDESISYGNKTMSRREAWSKVLRNSIDYWRTHRRSYTNQSMIVDRNIYTANRGLQLMSPALAVPEKQTLDYLYQSVGLQPW